MTDAPIRRARPPRRLLPIAALGGVLVAVAATVAWTVAGPGSVGDHANDAAAGARIETPVAAATTAPVAAPAEVPDEPPPSITVKVPPPPAPAPAAPPTGGGGSGLGPSDFARYCASPAAPVGASSARGLLDAANRERARLGIAPLGWSESLAAAARSWSATMAERGSLAHSSGGWSAENVGFASSSSGSSEGRAASIMHAGWVRSSGHCRNLMNPAYSVMGAGLASSGGGTTWYGTQQFR